MGYFDETLMPWRPPSDQRLSGGVPAAGADHDAGLHAAPDAPPPTRTASPSTLGDSYAQAQGRGSTSDLAKNVLVLFSGPYLRPDGLGTFLNQLGLEAVMVDNLPGKGGGDAHDITNDHFFADLQRRITSGECMAVIAAPPCGSFSVSRFFDSPSVRGGGPPPVRTRRRVTGRADVDPRYAKELKTANLIVERACTLLDLAYQSGAEFVLENPADRSHWLSRWLA
jgi:hypothetical protein